MKRAGLFLSWSLESAGKTMIFKIYCLPKMTWIAP
jgi:hypothetical protein